jgi:hypothetical protein
MEKDTGVHEEPRMTRNQLLYIRKDFSFLLRRVTLSAENCDHAQRKKMLQIHEELLSAGGAGRGKAVNDNRD